MAADGGVNARGVLGRFFKADGLNSPNEIRSSDLWVSNLQPAPAGDGRGSFWG